ncbi:MAG: aminoacyl-tRNA hydrolase [Sphingomonadales bacterium]|nr:aminoacyl-tRNA hydrolase [Sphingomonadales bacterium]
MQLWVGLGNPGTQYALHRHNVGFMALDVIAEDHGFSPWQKKFQGFVAEGRIGPEKIMLLKPQTYMNDSGRSIRAAADFYKLAAPDVTVFHDELGGGGTAGHNGLRSTEAHLANNFRRVRIGIGHPGHKDRVTGYVLGNYAKSEIEPLTDLLGAISREAEWLAKGDDARFMSEVALRLAD